MTRRLDITDELAKQRADRAVADLYPQFARSAVHKLFELGLIQMDGQALKAGYKLRTGESIFIEDDLLVAEPDDIELPVLYEDGDVLVVDKPVGILSHNRGSFNDEATVASWLRKHTSQLIDTAGAVPGNRAGIVHRLDRATSGVMICAKNAQSQSWLQKQFSQRSVKKTYVAIVTGHMPSEQGIIDMPIARNPLKPTTFIASTDGKPAKTSYKVVHNSEHLSLLELSPETGRTHQLRVHLAALNHPIVNDHLYGVEHPDRERLFLHAHKLEVTLPSSERRVFEAPIPAEFNAKLTADT